MRRLETMDQSATIKAKANEISGTMHEPLRHDSAHKHVAGTAEYIDDIPEPAGLLHGALGLSTIAHGEITSIDLSEVEACEGVIWVMTSKDIPGVNDVSSGGRHDEPLLTDKLVEFHGQPIFAVFATSRDIARRAARKAKITYSEKPFWTDIDGALANGAPVVTPGMVLKRGDAKAAIDAAPRKLTGTMRIGGQEHFYLEGHIAMAI